MRPTIRDVQRLHLVGVLKVFTTNWCALDCRDDIIGHWGARGRSFASDWTVTDLWRGAPDAAVASGAHAGRLGCTSMVVHQLFPKEGHLCQALLQLMSQIIYLDPKLESAGSNIFLRDKLQIRSF